MTRLIGLYPASWRARYEGELLALLADRPPSLSDRIDLVRGAVDARLHPDLVERGTGDGPVPLERRVPGLAAFAGGLVWVLMAVVAAFGLARGEEPDVTALFWIALILMVAGVVGSVAAAHAAAVRRGLVAAGILLGLGLVLPWEVKFIPVVPFLLLVGAGMLELAAVRAGLSTVARRWVVGLGFVLPFISMISIGLGLSSGLGASPWLASLSSGTVRHRLGIARGLDGAPWHSAHHHSSFRRPDGGRLHEQGTDRVRAICGADSLHPRLTERRAEARLRDHDRRRGRDRRAPGPRNALRRPGPPGEARHDRSAGAGGSTPTVPFDRASAPPPSGHSSRALPVSPDWGSTGWAGARDERAPASLSPRLAGSLRRGAAGAGRAAAPRHPRVDRPRPRRS